MAARTTGCCRTSPACPRPTKARWRSGSGALCIKLFGWLLGDVLGGAHRRPSASSCSARCRSGTPPSMLGRRAEAQPLRLAFGGQPEPATTAARWPTRRVLIYLGCLGLLLHSHETLAVTLQGALLACSCTARCATSKTARRATPCWSALALGLLALTRGWSRPPLAAAGRAVRCARRFLKLPAAPPAAPPRPGRWPAVLIGARLGRAGHAGASVRPVARRPHGWTGTQPAGVPAGTRSRPSSESASGSSGRPGRSPAWAAVCLAPPARGAAHHPAAAASSASLRC